MLTLAGSITWRTFLVMREQRRRLLKRDGTLDTSDHERASPADRLQRG